MRILGLVSIGFLFQACAEMVSVSQMKVAPSRGSECSLELVQTDMGELSPAGTKWDLLGIVSIGANHDLDATSEKARAMIRPKACELGGTAVSLLQAANSQYTMGQSSAIQFAVLRPKTPDAQAPSKF